MTKWPNKKVLEEINHTRKMAGLKPLYPVVVECLCCFKKFKTINPNLNRMCYSCRKTRDT